MSYNPHHWIDGEIITDQWMNHNEQGIQANSEDIARENARAVGVESELIAAIRNEIERATTAEAGKVNNSAVGSTIATLVGGKVPSSQLPSYVDDVIEGYYYESAFYEDSEHTFLITPESGKIYVDLTTSRAYRWSGSQYVLVGGVESVSTGVGLSGGTITSSGTIKAKLKSETASSLTAATRGSTANREYPVGVDANGDLSVNVPWDASGSKRAFYGTCSTAAATAAKEITLSDTTGWELAAGVIVGIKFTNSNSATNVTLDVNGSGAKSIYYNNAVYTDKANTITGYADRVSYYMYDGTYWVFLSNGIVDGRYDADATCTTAAATAAKVANASNYTLRNHNRFILRIKSANTSKSALTLNVNSTGAKSIYINGSASSSSNYTLPAGDYLVYYNDNKYYIRTDALITGSTTEGNGVKIGTSRQSATNSTLYFIHS